MPSEMLARLRTTPLTEWQKAKFILAIVGEQVEAEEIGSGDVLSCRFADLGNNFGFFLPLAGISTTDQIRHILCCMPTARPTGCDTRRRSS